MKKLKSCLLLFILILSLLACSDEKDTDVKNSSNSESETADSSVIDERVTAEGVVVVNDGSYLIIEDTSLIQMYTRGDKSIFDGLTTGDVIRIERDYAVAESFPGQVFIYSLEKLRDGNVYDIPREILDSLSELGWIKERDYNANEENNREIHESVSTEEVSCNYKNLTASLRVTEGWSYKIKEEGLYGPGFSITVIPQNGNGELILSYTDPQNILYDFTLPVGTTKEEYSLGDLPALKIYLPESRYWSYITSGDEGSFIILNNLEDNTFESLRNDIELMIGSVKINDFGTPIE
ncbi:MAG: hypothetical protein IKM46_07085 [Clostridia bacterium]|nr:hypothetical protein [Clostridia bacterium]